MGVDSDAIASRTCSDVLASPHVMDNIGNTSAQIRNLTESDISRRRHASEVDNEHVSSLWALPREVFWWARCFIVLRGSTVGGVLMEGEQFGVLDDCQFVRGKVVQLSECYILEEKSGWEVEENTHDGAK